MIKRDIQKNIKDWLSFGKDALLITGARQIGKTYLIRETLKDSKLPFIEFNFIENPSLVDLFKDAHSAEDILMRISLFSNNNLIKGETIIFFDEIQEVKDIVTSIKFLVDEGSYRYILSGSLLGIELNDIRSIPVGYMSILDMYPLTIKEFIKALAINDNVISKLEDSFQNLKPVDEFIHSKMIDIFYLYLIIGGMPEAIDTYIKTNDLSKVSIIHEKIKRLYRADFTKYETTNKLKLKEIYDSMAGQLNAENKRFKFNTIKKEISYDKLENSFLWLKDVGVALPVYNISEPVKPLIINEKRSLFKLFFSDVGLLTSYDSNMTKMAILNKDRSINNGALFENMIAQELKAKEFDVYYYSNKKYGELDFVIEIDDNVLPIEVKSGKGYKRHSAINNILNLDNYKINKAYIFSSENISVEKNKIYLPIYMIMFLKNSALANSVYKLDLDALK